MKQRPLFLGELVEKTTFTQPAIKLLSIVQTFPIRPGKTAHSPQHHRTLEIDEVRQIQLIRFGIQIRPPVLQRRIAQQNTDGDVAKRRVVIFEHEPVKQRTRYPTVAVAKRMLVTQDKMQRDGFDQWMKVVRLMRVVVGLIDPLRQPLQT
ncbi:hypothetical protein D3C81_1390950 [compost metagenome]